MLDRHGADRREHTYARDRLERAGTHDPIGMRRCGISASMTWSPPKSDDLVRVLAGSA
jgi:hypothetical protein